MQEGDIESYLHVTKQAKEFVEKLNSKEPVRSKKVKVVKCGFDNPCNFGEHNVRFDKNSIK